LNLAVAFYNVGTIWAHEIDIFRTWKLIDRAQFERVMRVVLLRTAPSKMFGCETFSPLFASAFQ
jgi:hypothetical protein